MSYRIKAEYIGYTPIWLVDYKVKGDWESLAAFRYKEEAEAYIAKDPVVTTA